MPLLSSAKKLALVAVMLLSIGCALLPPATATGGCTMVQPAGYVCAGDYGTYTPCEGDFSASSETTGVRAALAGAYIAAEGSHSCSRF